MKYPKIGQRVKVTGDPIRSEFTGMVIRNFPQEKSSKINGDRGASTKVEWKYLQPTDG